MEFTVQCEESGGQVLDKESDGRVSIMFAVQCEESGSQVPNTADSSCTVKRKEPESSGQVTRICKGKCEKCGKHKAPVSTNYVFYITFKKLYMYLTL